MDFDTLVCDRIYHRGKQAVATGDNRRQEVGAANVNNGVSKKSRPLVVGFGRLTDKIQVSSILRIYKC